MKTIIQLFLSAVFLFSLERASAQVSFGAKRGDYIFGINAGFAYQSSDIRSAANGGGGGFTLGRTVLAGAYAPISVDLRGRLLYARTFGLDPFRAYQIENNKALNGSGELNYLTYPVSLEEPRGFVFQNHRTTHGELGLEAVITLEELRRKTGIIASVYGGLGLNGYHTKIDQATADGSEYFAAYANLNDNRPVSAVLRDLRGSILDGIYETNADGFDGLPKFRLMPSVGVELGFHLTRSMSLHVGHRLTFSGTDLLDGQQWASQDKDMYHYTNFGLQWRFRVPERPAVLPPVIELTSPLSRPQYTRDPNGVVLANIRNVRSANEVTCTVNGRSTPFRFSGEQFALDIPLRPGRNDIVITARNKAGQAQGEAVIILEEVILPPPPPPVGYAPRVTFTNPSGRSATVSEPGFSLRATVSDVLNKNDVELTVDGARRDFSFDSRGNLSAQLNLREGVNRIRITARNNFGSDAADAEVVFEQRRFQPTVRIVEPAKQSEVQVNSATLRAEVRYVESQENIYLYVNSREVRNFSFDASREMLQATLTLSEGSNTVEVVARNRTGEARDAITITYRRVVQTRPPAVSITTPSAANTTTTAAYASIEATTRNVERREDISFFVNGARRDNFSFNASTGRLSATVDLVTGNNEIAIRVANADGSDQAAVSIRRSDQPVELPQPPRVRITNPANQFVSSQTSADLRATVDNVSDKNNISLVVNGKRFTTFNFNANSREMTATVTLAEGNNTIRVEASNRDGTASDEINVTYRKLTPPIVTITAPDNNSTVTNAAATLRARVQNATDRNQISVTLNNSAVSGFSFNTATGELSANVTLAEGNNALRVRAATTDGSDEKTVNVTYRKPAPPIVTITAPDNNSTVSDAAATLRARVQNANDRNQISVTLNNSVVNGFTFNTATGELSANVNLVEGANALRVRAATADGSDEKTVNVTYRKPAPPVVTISTPSNNATIEVNSVPVRAIITNVTGSRSVSFSINGTEKGQFTLEGSNFNATVENLREGENTFTIVAQNADGAAEASVKITYRPKIADPKPEVKFIIPARPGLPARSNTIQVKASVLHVSSKDDIQLERNGKPLGDFTYNTKSRELSANVSLEDGTNTIRIIATNAVGSDTASTTALNPQLAQLNPPVVVIESMSEPTLNPMNPTQGRSVVIAKVTGIDSAAQISFSLNGVAVTEFNYNSKSGVFQSTINLVRGTNTIVIRAENADGMDEKTRSIEF